MEVKKQRVLEAAGWRFGDAADFLGMTNEERQLLDARVEAALAVRRQRQVMNLSQKQLAARINTSQPRVAKIERAAPDVSLDQILRAFAAVGGKIAVKQIARTSSRNPRKGSRKQTKAGSVPQGDEVQIDLIGTAPSELNARKPT